MSHKDWVYIDRIQGYKNVNPDPSPISELINGSTFGVYNTFIIAGYLCLNLAFVLMNNGFNF
jgi:hypothetical protein